MKEEKITVSIQSLTTRPLAVFCIRVFSRLPALADSPNRLVQDARGIMSFQISQTLSQQKILAVWERIIFGVLVSARR